MKNHLWSISHSWFFYYTGCIKIATLDKFRLCMMRSFYENSISATTSSVQIGALAGSPIATSISIKYNEGIKYYSLNVHA